MFARYTYAPLVAFVTLGALLFASNAALAQKGSESKVDRKKLETMVSAGIDFLQSKGQAPDGAFSRQIGIGVTAMTAEALMRNGRTPTDPVVAKALKVIEESVQKDGGIYSPSGRLKTYETCVCVLCLTQANRNGKYDEIIANADKFLRGVPFDAAEGHDKDSAFYGGAGYGAASKEGSGRPDLSNTAFLIDALRSSGAKEDDEAIQNALIFVSRCQNLESQHNTTQFAAKINDGGFYYTPVSGKESTEPMDQGGLRSYGSMSYSGLKSMAFAGLKEEDPRVKAVVKWLGKNYTVAANPGMDDNGLYYYYLTFAKGLDAYGQDFVVDDKGNKHDWRKDLVDELAKRQTENGSWVNSNRKFMEGDPNLSTAFALYALSYCDTKAAAKPATNTKTKAKATK